MAFDTPNGTRGGRQPGRNRLERWGNRRMADRIRRKGSRGKLVLVTVGKRSGLERMTPVQWFPGGDDTKLIVASAAGGPRNPAWYYNLAAHPDRVRIEFAGQRIDVTPSSFTAKSGRRHGGSSRPVSGIREVREDHRPGDPRHPLDAGDRRVQQIGPRVRPRSGREWYSTQKGHGMSEQTTDSPTDARGIDAGRIGCAALTARPRASRPRLPRVLRGVAAQPRLVEGAPRGRTSRRARRRPRRHAVGGRAAE